MWRLLILSALAALTCAHPHEVDETRLGATAIRIGALENRLKKIKEKLTDAEKHDPVSMFDELVARVDHKEGNGCSARHFQCGGHDRECISDLFVCDGHTDCHNGHDESEDVCSTAPVKAGNVFTGTTTWTSCLVRDDHVTRIAITSTRRVKFFTARVRVTAQVSADYVVGADHHTETDSSPYHGYYNFGTRKLVLFPDDLRHIAVVCEFNKGDDERAECSSQLASKHPCAHTLIHLQ